MWTFSLSSSKDGDSLGLAWTDNSRISFFPLFLFSLLSYNIPSSFLHPLLLLPSSLLPLPPELSRLPPISLVLLVLCTPRQDQRYCLAHWVLPIGVQSGRVNAHPHVRWLTFWKYLLIQSMFLPPFSAIDRQEWLLTQHTPLCITAPLDSTLE